MAPRVRLFHHPFSHYCVSVERMLRFKRVKFQLVHVPIDDRAELLRTTHQDYIPALMWGGKFVNWGKIPSFLDAQVASPPLYPAKDPGLAVVLENWGHQVLEASVWSAMVTRLGAKLPTPGERWVFEEIQNRAWGPWHVLEARRKEFEATMHEHLSMVDAMLDGRDWLLEEPSLADFGVYGAMAALFSVGDRIPRDLRNLDRWAARIARL